MGHHGEPSAVTRKVTVERHKRDCERKRTTGGITSSNRLPLSAALHQAPDFPWEARHLPWIVGPHPQIHRSLHPSHRKRPPVAAHRVPTRCPPGGKLRCTFPQGLDFAWRNPHPREVISSSALAGKQASLLRISFNEAKAGHAEVSPWSQWKRIIRTFFGRTSCAGCEE